MINTQQLIEKLKPLQPEKIILFGSFTKGKPTYESDIDLLIVQKTKKKPVQRIAETLRLLWGNIPHIEPYVLTPKELDQAIAENRFFITQEIMKYGKTIYEKKN